MVHGNVPNSDAGFAPGAQGSVITNLPAAACVEVACLVDGAGLRPTRFGDLPPQLAAVNRTNVNVQELAVRAALEGSREHVHHAVALDPLTAALLTVEEIHQMTEELLDAHAELLPETLRS